MGIGLLREDFMNIPGKCRNCLFRKRLLALLPVLDLQGSSSANSNLEALDLLSKKGMDFIG